MNREVLERLIIEDYEALIHEDGFSPRIAEFIVYMRYQNGVYDTDDRLYN